MVKEKIFRSSGYESIIREFEKQIANYIGTKHAILCSSGRSAIRFSLLALEIGKGDEVIVPDYSGVIIPTIVLSTGASPITCDVDRETYSLSPRHFKKATSANTKAVIFTHLYGVPADPEPILEIAREKGIIFIDDAAQALGASIKGKMAGSFGDVGILSFNKFLDIPFGGAILTNNDEVAYKITLIRERYQEKPIFPFFAYWLMDILGIHSKKMVKAVCLIDNYLNRVRAMARGYSLLETNGEWNLAPHIIYLWKSGMLSRNLINQFLALDRKFWHRRRLEKLEIFELKREFDLLEENLKKRRFIAKIFHEKLNEEIIARAVTRKDINSSYMKFPVLFSDKKKRLKCINDLIRNDIVVNCLYKPLHTIRFLASLNNNDLSFNESIYLSDHLIPLPVNPSMTMEEIEEIISKVNLHVGN